MGELRVAVLGTRGFPGVQGGVERHTEELYTRLAASGVKIRVYARTCYVGSGVKDYNGVEIYPLWSPRSKGLEAIIHTLLGILHIAFTGCRYDILHIHAIGPSLLVPVARLFGLRLVVTNHGPDYNRKKWGLFAKTMLRLGEYFGTKYAASVIAVSQHIKGNLEERFGLTVSYIPNGVNMPDKTPAGDYTEGFLLKPEKYILAVGRLVPEKGFHDLITAFSEVDTDWKLVIAGGADHEDSYSSYLINLASDTERVVLTGFVTGQNLSELYSNAAFLVLPSYHEGLPITVLEAMSYGLPVLASSIPANMELVEAKNSFPPGDVEALKKKLIDFIALNHEENYATDLKKRIKEEFNWDLIADKTLKVYRSALDV